MNVALFGNRFFADNQDEVIRVGSIPFFLCFICNYSLLLFSPQVMSNSFVTAWTVASQASLSMGFSWQEHWSVLIKGGTLGRKRVWGQKEAAKLRQEDGHDASTSQGKPVMSGKPPEVRGSSLGQILPHSLRGTNLPTTRSQASSLQTVRQYISIVRVTQSVTLLLQL